MAQHDGAWPAGTPCWADLTVRDIEASKRFYRDLLGWEFDEAGEGFGGYTNARIGGRAVAALSPPMPGEDAAPPSWMVYLATDDVSALDGAVTSAGGRQIVAPMQVGPFGMMAIYADPDGAVFGAWQSGEHSGFDVTDEHGAVTWCDLMTSDLDTAKDFYGEVFGYTFASAGMEGMEYELAFLPGASEEAPTGFAKKGPDEADMPSMWAVCFHVDDVDAMVATVTSAGGAIVLEPADFPFGRLLIVSGPDGETFSLLTPLADA